jgi:hypothetical protein
MVGTRLKVATDVSWLILVLGRATLLAAVTIGMGAYVWLGVGVVLVETFVGNWVIGDMDGIRIISHKFILALVRPHGSGPWIFLHPFGTASMYSGGCCR